MFFPLPLPLQLHIKNLIMNLTKARKRTSLGFTFCSKFELSLQKQHVNPLNLMGHMPTDVKKPQGPPLLPNCKEPNVTLPTHITSNIQKAYQPQINSQFLVTQPGIEPGPYWLKRGARLVKRLHAYLTGQKMTSPSVYKTSTLIPL